MRRLRRAAQGRLTLPVRPAGLGRAGRLPVRARADRVMPAATLACVALGLLLLFLGIPAWLAGGPGPGLGPPPAAAQETTPPGAQDQGSGGEVPGGPRAPVWVTRVEGVIDPPLATYLVKTMRRAQEARAEALIIEIDTPGGLDSAMRQIIQAELDSSMPVIMYVFPQGARAASAGVYMLMGADVAAMAPQTNLGSATPVSLTGQMDEEMQRKVTNDAAAYIRALAAQHERNTEWVEQAVREAVSLTAEEALAQNVIEFVAADRDELLGQLEGYTTKPKGVTLRTAGAPIEEVEMGWHEKLLHAVVNPNVAFLLMLIGFYGLIFELQSPGVGAGGVVGIIALLLALYAFQALPVSYVGLALVVVAVVLYAAEVWVESGGLLAAGGTVALILGGLLLFDSPESFLRVDWIVIAIAALVSLAFFAFVITAVTRAHRIPATTGMQGMVGARGVVRLPLQPAGQVLIHGELWKAESEEGPLPAGEAVQVVGVEGMVLRVRRMQRQGA